MSGSRRRAALAVVLVPLLAVGLTACTDQPDDGAGPPAQVSVGELEVDLRAGAMVTRRTVETLAADAGDGGRVVRLRTPAGRVTVGVSGPSRHLPDDFSGDGPPAVPADREVRTVAWLAQGGALFPTRDRPGEWSLSVVADARHIQLGRGNAAVLPISSGGLAIAVVVPRDAELAVALVFDGRERVVPLG